MSKTNQKKGKIVSISFFVLIFAAFTGFSIEGLYFDENGNVGIGTTVPGAKLDVVGKIRTRDANGSWDLYGGTNLRFQANGVDKVFFGANGNVGIGTTSPSAKLDVAGRFVISGTAENLDMANVDSAGNGPGNISFLKNSSKLLIGWNRSRGCAEYDFIANRANDGYIGGFRFVDYSNGGAEKVLLTIQGNNGNVGIGTNSITTNPPSQKLVVYGNFDQGKQPESQLSHSHAVAIVGDAPGIDFINTSAGDDDWAIHVARQWTGTSDMCFMTGGWGTAVHFKHDGNVTIGGTLWQSSDIRYKKDIKTIQNSLDKIMQLRGVNFKWKDKNDNKQQMGLIAQEVEKVFPELVSMDDNGYKTVAYPNLIGALIEAIKEQQKQIEELKKDKVNREEK